LTTAIEQTVETYGIENWGAGYFDVNRKGNLIVRPAEGDPRGADLREIIDDLARRGISAPILLRFPQAGRGAGAQTAACFSKAIREFEYQGAHMCVYPMKVNQQRSVVEEYLREGSRYDFGLEAGSKAELYAAMALEQTPDSLLVLNGFKDEEFIQMAFAGAKSGKRVVIVVEKLSELDHILRIAEHHKGNAPIIGMRVKLYSKGSDAGKNPAVKPPSLA
jgi:arginine decarboxylase